MHSHDSQEDLGSVQIHKNVIASIASLAALEIDGAKRIGADFKSGILEVFGKKSLSAIKVEFTGHDEVKVQVPVIIKYGCNIPEVANRIQENILHHIEKMTNLTVRDVQIKVLGIERG